MKPISLTQFLPLLVSLPKSSNLVNSSTTSRYSANASLPIRFSLVPLVGISVSPQSLCSPTKFHSHSNRAEVWCGPFDLTTPKTIALGRAALRDRDPRDHVELLTLGIASPLFSSLDSSSLLLSPHRLAARDPVRLDTVIAGLLLLASPSLASTLNHLVPSSPLDSRHLSEEVTCMFQPLQSATHWWQHYLSAQPSSFLLNTFKSSIRSPIQPRNLLHNGR